MRLRDLNFKNTGPSNDGKPRSAQIKVIQKFIGKLKT